MSPFDFVQQYQVIEGSTEEDLGSFLKSLYWLEHHGPFSSALSLALGPIGWVDVSVLPLTNKASDLRSATPSLQSFLPVINDLN